MAVGIELLFNNVRTMVRVSKSYLACIQIYIHKGPTIVKTVTIAYKDCFYITLKFHGLNRPSPYVTYIKKVYTTYGTLDLV